MLASTVQFSNNTHTHTTTAPPAPTQNHKRGLDNHKRDLETGRYDTQRGMPQKQQPNPTPQNQGTCVWLFLQDPTGCRNPTTRKPPPPFPPTPPTHPKAEKDLGMVLLEGPWPPGGGELASVSAN